MADLNQVYLLEYDNGESYSDRFHDVVGIYRTLDGAKAGAAGEDRRRWDDCWNPRRNNGEMFPEDEAQDWTVTGSQWWQRGAIQTDEYWTERGSYTIKVMDLGA